MDPRIGKPKTTTFRRHRLTRMQIALMQETVGLFPNDSRRELDRTPVENFGWTAPSGSCREQLCLRILEQLEALDILTLPDRRRMSAVFQKRGILAVNRAFGRHSGAEADGVATGSGVPRGGSGPVPEEGPRVARTASALRPDSTGPSPSQGGIRVAGRRVPDRERQAQAESGSLRSFRRLCWDGTGGRRLRDG